VFLPPNAIARFIPRRGGLAALTGGLLGLFFPVCECGVIPLTRRLIRKGLPLSAGVAFLLAAPVLNPIVILSTAAAFGVGKVLWLRLGLSLLIAVVTGLVFSVEADPQSVLRETHETHTHERDHAHTPASRAEKWRAALLIAIDEFFEMGRYLVVGAMLAALMQTFVPQAALLSVGQGALLSVVVMAALAILLSICSTVDAFVALGFVNTFSAGSILTFLVFGPMVDIKSMLMYSRAFRARPILYLVLIPLLMSLLSGSLINLYFPGLK
ncbi:MAG: permease, partial [Chloroflexota bacterium]